METIIIKNTSKQAKIVVEMLKTFPFVEFVKPKVLVKKQKKDEYDPKFVAIMKKSENDIKNGDCKTVDTNNIWESLGLK